MYENVKLFQRIPTFNVNNFTTEIKNSNTFVGFCYVKIKLEKKKKTTTITWKTAKREKLQRFAQS